VEGLKRDIEGDSGRASGATGRVRAKVELRKKRNGTWRLGFSFSSVLFAIFAVSDVSLSTLFSELRN